jgi:hypothetical protein
MESLSAICCSFLSLTGIGVTPPSSSFLHEAKPIARHKLNKLILVKFIKFIFSTIYAEQAYNIL